MEEDFKEEIIVEEDEAEDNNTVEKQEKKAEKQIVITKESIPFILSIVAICLSFFKTFFTLVIPSYTAAIILRSIFFFGAVACAVASLIIILSRSRKVTFTPDFVLSLVAILVSFI